MKVKELKKILEEANPEAEVILEAPRGDYHFNVSVGYTYPDGGVKTKNCVCLYLISNEGREVEKKMKKKDNYLSSLLMTPSPSGDESRAVSLFQDYCRDYYLVTEDIDKIGNCVMKIGKGPTKILLSAHIDELGMYVQGISDSGMLNVVSSGGIDNKVLLGSRVDIITDSGKIIPGIIGKIPIHLDPDYGESSEYPKLSSMRVDLGYETKKEVEKLGITVGSRVVYHRDTELSFGTNRIMSQGLDDKIGVYVVSRIAAKLGESSYSGKPVWYDTYTVYVAATVQEEAGLRGATVLAQSIKPDISIDFDVTFSTDCDIDDIKTEELGEINLGSGGVIEYGPDKSRRLNDIFREVANNSSIPYQVACGRAGGTNTDVLQLYGGNCETTLISIPNRNMHTPVEVCDYRDIESIVSMVSESIIGTKL